MIRVGVRFTPRRVARPWPNKIIPLTILLTTHVTGRWLRTLKSSTVGLVAISGCPEGLGGDRRAEAATSLSWAPFFPSQKSLSETAISSPDLVWWTGQVEGHSKVGNYHIRTETARTYYRRFLRSRRRFGQAVAAHTSTTSRRLSGV